MYSIKCSETFREFDLWCLSIRRFCRNCRKDIDDLSDRLTNFSTSSSEMKRWTQGLPGTAIQNGMFPVFRELIISNFSVSISIISFVCVTATYRMEPSEFVLIPWGPCPTWIWLITSCEPVSMTLITSPPIPKHMPYCHQGKHRSHGDRYLQEFLLRFAGFLN